MRQCAAAVAAGLAFSSGMHEKDAVVLSPKGRRKAQTPKDFVSPTYSQ